MEGKGKGDGKGKDFKGKGKVFSKGFPKGKGKSKGNSKSKDGGQGQSQQQQQQQQHQNGGNSSGNMDINSQSVGGIRDSQRSQLQNKKRQQRDPAGEGDTLAGIREFVFTTNEGKVGSISSNVALLDSGSDAQSYTALMVHRELGQ
eukprot:2034041-Amphidinium_carterae.1